MSDTYKFIVTIKVDAPSSFTPKSWLSRMNRALRRVFESYSNVTSTYVDFVEPDNYLRDDPGRRIEMYGLGEGGVVNNLVSRNYQLYQAELGGEYREGKMPRPVESADDANLIGSGEQGEGSHRICLDIDRFHLIRPSRTPGHIHLFFPQISMPWDRYKKLLGDLADVGIIEEGYVQASIKQGATFLRAHPTVTGFKDDVIPESMKEKGLPL